MDIWLFNLPGLYAFFLLSFLRCLSRLLHGVLADREEGEIKIMERGWKGETQKEIPMHSPSFLPFNRERQ